MENAIMYLLEEKNLANCDGGIRDDILIMRTIYAPSMLMRLDVIGIE